jgi:hypothetical protein
MPLNLLSFPKVYKKMKKVLKFQGLAKYTSLNFDPWRSSLNLES